MASTAAASDSYTGSDAAGVAMPAGLAAALQRHYLFSSLAPSELRGLMRDGFQLTSTAGEPCFYLVAAGTYRVTSGASPGARGATNGSASARSGRSGSSGPASGRGQAAAAPADASGAAASVALPAVRSGFGSNMNSPPSGELLQPGDSVGEASLLFTRAPDVHLQPVSPGPDPAAPFLLWRLDRASFRGVLAATVDKNVSATLQALRRVPLLSPLSEDQLALLSYAVREERHAEGTQLIRKGEAGDCLYFLLEGSVVCSSIGSGATAADDVHLGPGCCFGERALLLDEPRAADVTVNSAEGATLLRLDRTGVNHLLGPLQPLLDAGLEQLRRTTTLRAVPVLSSLTEQQLAAAARAAVKTAPLAAGSLVSILSSAAAGAGGAVVAGATTSGAAEAAVSAEEPTIFLVLEGAVRVLSEGEVGKQGDAASSGAGDGGSSPPSSSSPPLILGAGDHYGLLEVLEGRRRRDGLDTAEQSDSEGEGTDDKQEEQAAHAQPAAASGAAPAGVAEPVAPSAPLDSLTDGSSSMDGRWGFHGEAVTAAPVAAEAGARYVLPALSPTPARDDTWSVPDSADSRKALPASLSSTGFRPSDADSSAGLASPFSALRLDSSMHRAGGGAEGADGAGAAQAAAAAAAAGLGHPALSSPPRAAAEYAAGTPSRSAGGAAGDHAAVAAGSVDPLRHGVRRLSSGGTALLLASPSGDTSASSSRRFDGSSYISPSSPALAVVRERLSSVGSVRNAGLGSTASGAAASGEVQGLSLGPSHCSTASSSRARAAGEGGSSGRWRCSSCGSVAGDEACGTSSCASRSTARSVTGVAGCSDLPACACPSCSGRASTPRIDGMHSPHVRSVGGRPLSAPGSPAVTQPAAPAPAQHPAEQQRRRRLVALQNGTVVLALTRSQLDTVVGGDLEGLVQRWAASAVAAASARSGGSAGVDSAHAKGAAAGAPRGPSTPHPIKPASRLFRSKAMAGRMETALDEEAAAGSCDSDGGDAICSGSGSGTGSSAAVLFPAEHGDGSDSATAVSAASQSCTVAHPHMNLAAAVDGAGGLDFSTAARRMPGLRLPGSSGTMPGSFSGASTASGGAGIGAGGVVDGGSLSGRAPDAIASGSQARAGAAGAVTDAAACCAAAVGTSLLPSPSQGVATAATASAGTIGKASVPSLISAASSGSAGTLAVSSAPVAAGAAGALVGTTVTTPASTPDFSSPDGLRAISSQPEPGMSLADLQRVVLVGKGTFGRVWLVRHAASGRILALKELRKRRVLAMRQGRNLAMERAVLYAPCFNHPFLLRGVCSFQDAKRVYLLTEAVTGGELFGLLTSTENGYLPLPSARFYAGCVLSALSCLHSQQLVYRDLKPENILLTIDGYAKLCDFGFARYLAVGERTFTLCGTPAYLAPEIVRGTGYSGHVDWWALGILLFEMLAGYAPFEMEEPVETMRAILSGPLEFPAEWDAADEEAAALEEAGDHAAAATLSYAPARDLISRLLSRNLVDRLGCRRSGPAEIFSHPFFDGQLDFKALLAQSLPAPWVPRLNDELDTHYFEDYSSCSSSSSEDEGEEEGGEEEDSSEAEAGGGASAPGSSSGAAASPPALASPKSRRHARRGSGHTSCTDTSSSPTSGSRSKGRRRRGRGSGAAAGKACTERANSSDAESGSESDDEGSSAEEDEEDAASSSDEEMLAEEAEDAFPADAMWPPKAGAGASAALSAASSSSSAGSALGPAACPAQQAQASNESSGTSSLNALQEVDENWFVGF